MVKFLSYRVLVLPLVSAILLASCVRLDLKTADTGSETTGIAFTVDWGDVAEADRPEPVVVALSKLSDGLKYSFTTDASGAFIEADGENSGTDADGTDTDSPEDETVRYVEYGSYVMLAYAGDISSYTVSGTEDYLTDRAVSLRDFRAKVNDLSLEELDEMRDGSRLDFNAAYRFICSPAPVWCAPLKTDVSDVHSNVFTLVMQPRICRLTVSVSVTAESGIDVSSVVAELSGVPTSFSFIDGETDTADLAKVIFRMTHSGGVWSGTVNVPGIFHSDDITLRTGPGILRLALTAEKDGVKKVIHPAVNIRSEIISSSIMKQLSGSDGYFCSRGSATIAVSGVLKVGADSFATVEGGDGVAEWYDSDEPIDVEI